MTIAAASTEQVVQVVMKAHSENGRITWQPEATPTRSTGLAEALAEREAALDPEPPSSDAHTSDDRGLSRCERDEWRAGGAPIG